MNILIILNTILIITLAIIGGYSIYNKKENNNSNNKLEEQIKIGEVDELLIFTIESDRINCKTVYLNVYNDFTYEYFYEYNENDNEYISKVDKYSYDVNKIIENNGKYINKNIPYLLTDNTGNIYNVYDNNKELNEFLNSINVNLDTCINIIN